MSLFRHPHLVRGVVHTAKGAFVLTRGTVEIPDELGEALGWARVEAQTEADASPASRNRLPQRASRPAPVV